MTTAQLQTNGKGSLAAAGEHAAAADELRSPHEDGTPRPASARPSLNAKRYVHIQTFGCQMNVNDTDRILQVLAPHDYVATDDPAQASLILLNTCSVRDKAEQKMMSQLGRLAPLKEHNDELVLGVAGCVAQQEGADLLKKVPYLDLVFGPDHIAELPQLIERVKGSEKRVAETEFYKRKGYQFVEAEPLPRAPDEKPKVSDFVTIMKGCDKVCTYCIVPFTRGREVSKPSEMVLREVKRLVESGVREVTLLGQNVNSYGKDLSESGEARFARVPTFAQLLREVDAVPGLERIRFTTSHPMDAIDDLIACFGELRTLCEYFHLPVQSGSDRVLEGMRRFYSIAHYHETVAKLRAQCPDIALSTDIIVGFPGETEADFEDSLKLLAAIEYDSIYAFKYSPRPGTKALSLGDTVSEADKERRLEAVLQLQKEVSRKKLLRYVGKTLEVLVEGPSTRTSKGQEALQLGQKPSFQMMGRTRTNVIVNVPVPLGDFWSKRWVGQLANVVVEDAKANSLFGRFA